MTTKLDPKVKAAFTGQVYDKARNVPTVCTECGADFRCRTGEEGECWCLTSPNIKLNYDLDGTCLCPNCMADGKLVPLKQARDEKRAKRDAHRLKKVRS